MPSTKEHRNPDSCIFPIQQNAQIDALPWLISYSPLQIPLSSSHKEIALSRRDLFDTRFQLISEGAGDDVDPVRGEGNADGLTSSITDRKALEFLDALVLGV